MLLDEPKIGDHNIRRIAAPPVFSPNFGSGCVVRRIVKSYHFDCVEKVHCAVGRPVFGLTLLKLLTLLQKHLMAFEVN